MKKLYKQQLNYKIGGYPAVGMNEDDICLAGPLGEIWMYSASVCRGFYILGDSEKLITFDIKELPLMIKKLKIPYHASQQLKWANNPNLRLKRIYD